MQTITHDDQQSRWDKEHQQPKVLPQMDSTKGSSGVVKFLEWLKATGKTPNELSGMEMCCGKGRNVIWMAEQGVQMTGIDFAPAAIEEAQKRAKEASVEDKTRFIVQDATLPSTVSVLRTLKVPRGEKPL
jgi:ubiquinone/menaquinone biosynthesis C-methylase UbiE